MKIAKLVTDPKVIAGGVVGLLMVAAANSFEPTRKLVSPREGGFAALLRDVSFGLIDIS